MENFKDMIDALAEGKHFDTNEIPYDTRCEWNVGDRVEKQNSEPDNKVQDGKKGTIMGGTYHPHKGESYFILFDENVKELPLLIHATMKFKLKLL